MRDRTPWILAAMAVYTVAAFALIIRSIPPPAPFPDLELATDDGGDSFHVVSAEPGLQWEDFRPVGCNRRPSGSVDVGDELTGCAGSVVLEYTGGR